MEKINIAVRKLVEILLEDTEFVIERLPKKDLKLNLNILLSSRIVLLVWLQCTTLLE